MQKIGNFKEEKSFGWQVLEFHCQAGVGCQCNLCNCLSTFSLSTFSPFFSTFSQFFLNIFSVFLHLFYVFVYIVSTFSTCSPFFSTFSPFFLYIFSVFSPPVLRFCWQGLDKSSTGNLGLFGTSRNCLSTFFSIYSPFPPLFLLFSIAVFWLARLGVPLAS